MLRWNIFKAKSGNIVKKLNFNLRTRKENLGREFMKAILLAVLWVAWWANGRITTF